MSYLGTSKIGKMYLGSTEIAKAYLGNTLVFQKGGGPMPPSEIPYIRNTSLGAYIDTGITADNTVRVIVWARNWNPTAGALFGSRTSTTQGGFAAFALDNANAGAIRHNFGATGTVSQDAWRYLSGYHKYEHAGDKFYVDDVLLIPGTSETFSNNLNIHLFGVNSNGTRLDMTLPADICAAKIYKNGVLVRDFTAVSTPSVGLYDAVSETLFTNAGSGSFTYGEFNPNAYTPIEYIETQGDSYFVSDVSGTHGLSSVVAFMPTGTTARFYRVIGARNTSPNRYFEIATGNGTYRNAYLYLTLGSSASTAYSSNTNDYLKNKKLVALKRTNQLTAYYNHSQVGSTITGTSDTSFDTVTKIGVGYSNGASAESTFYGRIYYVNLGVGCSYVPALVNNVAGMYDTYNDVFSPSDTATPFIAGPEYPARTTFFRNKKIAIIGDSISTYDEAGYKYDSYRMYYPAGNVDTVDETWWKLLMDSESCPLDVNLAFSGSFSSNFNPDYPTFYDRTNLITDAEIIIVAIGTNDSTNSVSLGTFDYTTEPENLDMSKFRESYIKGIRSLMTLYPSASIVCAIFSMGSDYRESIKTIAEHYGLDVVDCGNDYEKYTTVHPNAFGMAEIYRNFLYV